MKRLFAVVVCVVLVASCSRSKEEPDQAVPSGTTSGGAGSGQIDTGRPAIPDVTDSVGQFSDFEEAAQARLRPCFDMAGAQTSKTVAPDEQFNLFVVAEFSDLYSMSAAEYKLVLPEGIVVLGTAHTDSTIITLGKYDEDFMIAFRCLTGPRHWIAKYVCKIDDGFTGGTVEIVQGQNLNFLGFVTCDASKTEIRAHGGKAELRKK